MKTPKSSRLPQTGRLGFIVALIAASLCVTTRAGLQIPYTPDANTLHLWHLDDPDGLTATDAVTTASITLTNIGQPNPGPATNAHFGAVSFPGQGTCLQATTKPHLLFGGTFPDVSSFCNPESGAFTFEAILRVDASFNPLDAEIVSGDNGGGITTRGWQWRLFNGVMEWDLLAGSTDNDFKSTLPTTGPNAAISNTWYHAAVTYTGQNPTNGDAANVITFYWTLLDANRTAADQLGQFTATRPLSGSPQGTAAPNLGIAGSGRQITTNPGNNEGLLGRIDEIRISSVALRSNQMAFIVGGTFNPPSITRQPPTNTLVGYGQTITVPALISGTPPLHFQWRKGGSDVGGQTDTTLVIPNATFDNGGSYQLVVTNVFGSITTSVAQVTIGAAPTGLFNTGLDTNGVVSSGDIPDPHWTLYRSADPAYLGPDTLIFEYAFPIQFADPNGAFSPTNGISMWTGLGGNMGGVTVSSPIGQYLYRARFLIDSADPATVTLGGSFWVNGTVNSILVNGVNNPVTQPVVGTLYVSPFTLTNGFRAGWNTIDFVENMTGAGISGVRVEISGVGQALPPGLPTIIEQPADQTVRDGSVPGGTSKALFSVAALGRPPLLYQWWANGAPLTGATNRTLTFINPIAGAQGTNFSVIVSNDSGSVTSRIAKLTIVPTNQPPVAATFSFVAFQGQTLALPLSDIVQVSVDPDHDPIVFNSADASSTNGGSVTQNGATLVYTPVSGYVGADQFTYSISDSLGASAQGLVDLLVISQPTPTNTVVAPGGSASFSVGLASAPAGYAFQWQLNGTNIAGATTGQLSIPVVQLSNSGSYRLVVTDPLGQPWPSPVAGLTVGVLGNGTGLTGDYYGYANSTTNFTGLPTLTRMDSTIDFDFGTGSPDPSLPADGFQIRWHGQVQPLFSDLYTFSTTTDDGARLWVNGQLLVNQWQNQAATTVNGTIQLVAGQKYDILMEYYENTSVASAQLSWSSVHQPAQVIGMTQLYPTAGLVQPVLSAATFGTTLVVNWAGTFTLQTAPSVTGPWTPVVNSGIGPYTTSIGAAPRVFYRLVDPISP
jgi:hypothetical protein